MTLWINHTKFMYNVTLKSDFKANSTRKSNLHKITFSLIQCLWEVYQEHTSHCQKLQKSMPYWIPSCFNTHLSIARLLHANNQRGFYRMSYNSLPTRAHLSTSEHIKGGTNTYFREINQWQEIWYSANFLSLQT